MCIHHILVATVTELSIFCLPSLILYMPDQHHHSCPPMSLESNKKALPIMQSIIIYFGGVSRPIGTSYHSQITQVCNANLLGDEESSFSTVQIEEQTDRQAGRQASRQTDRSSNVCRTQYSVSFTHSSMLTSPTISSNAYQNVTAMIYSLVDRPRLMPNNTHRCSWAD